MPFPLFAALLAGALGLTVALAIACWPRILEWAETSLLPWVERNVPTLEGAVREAFVALNHAATTVRRLAKEAWSQVRQYLLKQALVLQRRTSSEWVKKVTTWVIKTLESGQKVPVKLESETTVDWDDLPADVQAEWLRNQQDVHEVNVTEVREKEIEELAH